MKIILTIFALLIAENCNQKEIQTNLLQEIESVYIQNWVGGREETGGGTNLFIQFKKSLPKEIVFKKAYFKNQTANLVNRSNNLYVAYFTQKKQNINLNSQPEKEYGNLPPETSKYSSKLKENQAIIEYEISGKTNILTIKNIKEKEAIAYPSAKPKE